MSNMLNISNMSHMSIISNMLHMLHMLNMFNISDLLAAVRSDFLCYKDPGLHLSSLIFELLREQLKYQNLISYF